MATAAGRIWLIGAVVNALIALANVVIAVLPDAPSPLLSMLAAWCAAAGASAAWWAYRRDKVANRS